ncbi:MAG TPA: glycosyl hydrolase [Candidatus Saccharimonadales bacterium]|nr:glycosyl hydrolase [Candidatus Saccharimonadales bacterium]
MVKFGGYFHPFPIWDGVSRLEKAEKVLGRHVDVVMWYAWWKAGLLQGGKRASKFQPKWVSSVDDRDVYIKWEPWKPGKKIVQPELALATIVDGKHDAYIREWAVRIRDCSRTIYVSPMPEMNGFWNQWSVPVGHHDPKLFIEAWRYIHGIFVAEEATNAKFVWAPNAGDMPSEYPMELFYPGADSVDVLGLSVYNWGTARPWSKWQSCQEVFQPYYDRIAKLGKQPIWVAEMGCAPVGGDKAAWIREALVYLPTLSRLEAAIWFDMKKETDWRITTPSIAPLFRKPEQSGAT